PATFTATITPVSPGAGTPGGSVIFLDGAAPIGSGTVGAGGVASASVSSLNAGPHTINAQYSGDGNFSVSSGTLSYSIGKAGSTSVLAAAPAGPSTYGQAVTLTATITPVAPGSGVRTGTVTFLDGATPIGTGSVGAGGVATLIVSSLTGGAHSLTAQYGGD